MEAQAGYGGFIARAEEIFLRPRRQYSWHDVITGARVLRKGGGFRTIEAVSGSTWRAFAGMEPKRAYAGYLVQQRARLKGRLSAVTNEEDLEQLLEEIAAAVRKRLGNTRPELLASYNRVRKPIDLYIEHLVSMSEELADIRGRLVPLLKLPIDKWMFNSFAVFSETELTGVGLSRGLSFGAIGDKATYDELQSLLKAKATRITKIAGMAFHPIYFDLFWNDRFKRWGSNLFETCPDDQ